MVSSKSYQRTVPFVLQTWYSSLFFKILDNFGCFFMSKLSKLSPLMWLYSNCLRYVYFSSCQYYNALCTFCNQIELERLFQELSPPANHIFIWNFYLRLAPLLQWYMCIILHRRLPPNCIKDFLDLPDDTGQSGLTLQLLPMVILVNQVWRYNCFHWKQL